MSWALVFLPRWLRVAAVVLAVVAAIVVACALAEDSDAMCRDFGMCVQRAK